MMVLNQQNRLNHYTFLCCFTHVIFLLYLKIQILLMHFNLEVCFFNELHLNLKAENNLNLPFHLFYYIIYSYYLYCQLRLIQIYYHLKYQNSLALYCCNYNLNLQNHHHLQHLRYFFPDFYFCLLFMSLFQVLYFPNHLTNLKDYLHHHLRILFFVLLLQICFTYFLLNHQLSLILHF